MTRAEKAERNALIISAYERGDHVSAIAANFGVSLAIVYAAIKEGRAKGLVTRTHRSSSVDLEERAEKAKTFAALYESGMSFQKIGKMFNLTGEAVRRTMVRSGVELPNGTRDAAYYGELRYQSFVSEHGDAVNAAFEQERNFAAVVAKFPNVPSSHLRRLLEPKLNTSIHSRPSRAFWNQERIISLLKVVADGRDRLSTGDYDKWRDSGALYEGRIPPTKLVICWRFGTWNDAVAQAGLRPTSPKRRVYTRSWNRDDAVSAVRTYIRESLESGERPTSSGYEKWSPSKEGVPCRATLGYASGGMTWSEMLREAFATMGGEA